MDVAVEWRLEPTALMKGQYVRRFYLVDDELDVIGERLRMDRFVFLSDYVHVHVLPSEDLGVGPGALCGSSFATVEVQ